MNKVEMLRIQEIDKMETNTANTEYIFNTIAHICTAISDLILIESDGIDVAEDMVDILRDELKPLVKDGLKMTNNVADFIDILELYSDDIYLTLFSVWPELREILDIDWDTEIDYILWIREMLDKSYKK